MNQSSGLEIPTTTPYGEPPRIEPNTRLQNPSLETVKKMEGYIKEGLELIRQGLYKEAERHFTSQRGMQDIGTSAGMGEIQQIQSLRSRAELYTSLAKIAGQSRIDELPSYLWKNWQRGSEMEDMSELYNPELLREFRYEIALMFAEEWIHKLQRRMKAPVAGEKDEEIDVAAYLEREGLDLSDNFVTRYERRKDWFINKHPEREASIRAFEVSQVK